MCISVSYLLGDESKCTFSMDLTNEDKLDKGILYSSNIKESVIGIACVFKYVIRPIYILLKCTKSLFIQFNIE